MTAEVHRSEVNQALLKIEAARDTVAQLARQLDELDIRIAGIVGVRPPEAGEKALKGIASATRMNKHIRAQLNNSYINLEHFGRML